MTNYNDFTAAILEVGETISPANPQGATYHDAGDVLYVFATEAGRVTKAASSSGELVGFDFGKQVRLIADQSGRSLGRFRVTGIVRADGTIVGDAPSRRVKHYVFK